MVTSAVEDSSAASLIPMNFASELRDDIAQKQSPEFKKGLFVNAPLVINGHFAVPKVKD